MKTAISTLALLFSVHIVSSTPIFTSRTARQTGASASSSSSASSSGSAGNFGIGAAAGIGGVGASSGLGSFAADTRTNPFLPFGAFAGINLPRAGRYGAGCSGLSCGVQFGDFVAQLPFVGHSDAGGEDDEYYDDERVALLTANPQPVQDYLVKDYAIVRDPSGKEYAVKQHASIVKESANTLGDYSVVKDAGGKEYLFVRGGNDPRSAKKTTAVVGLKASTLVTPAAQTGVNSLVRGLFGGFRGIGDTLSGFFTPTVQVVATGAPVTKVAIKSSPAVKFVAASPSPVVEYVEASPPQAHFVAASPSPLQYVAASPPQTQFVAASPSPVQFIAASPPQAQFVAASPSPVQFVAASPSPVQYVEASPPQTHFVSASPSPPLFYLPSTPNYIAAASGSKSNYKTARAPQKIQQNSDSSSQKQVVNVNVKKVQ